MKAFRFCISLLAAALAPAVSFAAPERLEDGHVDIGIAHHPEAPPGGRLRVYLAREEEEIDPATAVLALGESARVELPGGTPFGAAGDPFWILPQSQTPGLPFVGFSGEEVAPEDFPTGVRLMLVSVVGPGHVYLWQAPAPGELEVLVNSADGIGLEDAMELTAGSHRHVNIGFSANGVYKVTFRAMGIPAGSQEPIVGEPTTLVFHVEPIPATPYQLWVAETLAGVAPDDAAPGADPDQDGRINLVEFHAGTDPLEADTTAEPVFQLSLVEMAGKSRAILQFRRSSRAAEVGLVVKSSPSLQEPQFTEARGSLETISSGPGFEILRFTDENPVESEPSRFYSIGLELAE